MAKLEEIARKRITWVLVLVVGYVSSYFWLGEDFLAVPFVILTAPIGLGNFIPESSKSPLIPMYLMIFGHTIFWGLFAYFLTNIKKVNVRTLYTISLIILLVIVTTLIGCSIGKYDSWGMKW